MRLARISLVAALALAPASVLAADDLTGHQRLLCTASLTTVCTNDGECESGPPWNWNVPQFIVVDLAQKRLATTRASGENRTTPIVHLQRDEGHIVIQGYENRRAFSFVIEEKTGFSTMAVAQKDLAATVFGACTPMPDSE